MARIDGLEKKQKNTAENTNCRDYQAGLKLAPDGHQFFFRPVKGRNVFLPFLKTFSGSVLSQRQLSDFSPCDQEFPYNQLATEMPINFLVEWEEKRLQMIGKVSARSTRYCIDYGI